MRASAAILGHVNVHFSCHDAHSTQKQLILPWFTGSWSWDSPAHNNISVVARTKLIKHACCLFWCAALHQVRPDMLYDVPCRAMTLVGDGPAKRTMTAANTATSFVPQLATSLLPQSPLFHVELDDTATAQQRIYSRIVGRHTAWTVSRSVGVGGFTAIMDSCFDHPHARSLQGLERQRDDWLLAWLLFYCE
jgi:hypothetical protein